MNLETYRALRDVNTKAQQSCFDLVLWHEQHPESKALNIAINYARWAVLCPQEELPTQILSVLSNITHWRGEVATQVRNTLEDCTIAYKRLEQEDKPNA